MSLIAQRYTWSAALAFVEKGAFRRSQAVISPKEISQWHCALPIILDIPVSRQLIYELEA